VALITLTLSGEGSKPYISCLQNAPGGLHTYSEQHCLAKFLPKLYHLLGPGNRNKKNLTEAAAGKIRIWWHREGYWRTALHMREAPRDRGEREVFENLYSLCYPSSDLIGHGDKKYADVLELHQSSECNISRVLGLGGRSSHCSWLSYDRELALVRAHCQWRYDHYIYFKYVN